MKPSRRSLGLTWTLRVCGILAIGRVIGVNVREGNINRIYPGDSGDRWFSGSLHRLISRNPSCCLERTLAPRGVQSRRMQLSCHKAFGRFEIQALSARPVCRGVFDMEARAALEWDPRAHKPGLVDVEDQ